MAVQILNLSVDAVDFNPLQSNSSKVFNYYNSVVEFVSERICQKDIFPELPQKNPKGTQLTKHLNFKIFQLTNNYSTVIVTAPLAKKFNALTNEQCSWQFCKEINPPPPKFVAS